MKKTSLLFAASFCLSILSGCGGQSNPPGSKFEKVQYALNGVDRSLKNQKSAAKNKFSPKGKRSEKDALDAIAAIFPEGSSGLPDFKYDEPPMIQFQYIKKTLEKVGNGFEFGAKYQETLTGSIYYDFSTGKETMEPEYKQEYSMDFSLFINIDDNDLIDCKVSFDIDYVHESESHHQVMFSEILLSYDMNKSDANYNLKLYTLDDATAFSDDREKYFSAEFDYVNVANDAIGEWGKIGYSTNKAIVFDSSHASLSDYLQQGDLNFKPYAQLYRNGKHSQRNQLSDEQIKQVALIASDDLGVNGSDIKYKEYVALPSKPQAALRSCYEDFSRIYGRDLAYSIVYTGAKEHEQQEEVERVHSSWPTQGLIDDGYPDVPGFSSKTATFSVSKEIDENGSDYIYMISVLNYDQEDFEHYRNRLVELGFVEQKTDSMPIYLHSGDDGQFNYFVGIARANGADMIIVGKVYNDSHQAIEIQNGEAYDGDYSRYEETSYNDAYQVASILESVSGGQIKAGDVSKYAIPSSSKSYRIYFDKGEYSSDDVKRNYEEYAKSYSGWKVAHEGSAFYKTIGGIDALILLEKDSGGGILDIHSLAFSSGSIAEILNGGGGQGQGSDSQQEPLKIATIYLYEVDSKGNSEFIDSFVYDEGSMIDVFGEFGPGEYYRDSGCTDKITDALLVYDGMTIFRKKAESGPTQGKIAVYDANNNQLLFEYTDVIGATVSGGAIYEYVLYYDASCTSMVKLNETLTLEETDLVLYCRDHSQVDYVTLTVNTYINGILSPNHIREFGIRRGKIMSNYSSYSFPSYYDVASFYDQQYTMKLDGVTLSPYSSDLVALTMSATLDIYCVNDWCKVYHLQSGGETVLDFLWEGGSLSEGDTICSGSRYYHISSVSGDIATYDYSETAYTYTICSVYNGKIITTTRDYFRLDNEGHGMTFVLGPGQDSGYFLDIDLTTPLQPEEGKDYVEFNNSFTLYTAFAG